MAALVPLVPHFLRSPACSQRQRQRTETTPRDGRDTGSHQSALEPVITTRDPLSDNRAGKLTQHLLILSNCFSPTTQ